MTRIAERTKGLIFYSLLLFTRTYPFMPNFLKHFNPRWLLAFLSGILLPFGFAPFHLPGLSLLGLAFFFALLNNGRCKTNPSTQKQAFLTGFIFGLGYLGLGVSWVFISIHDYGHLNILLSGLLTFLFIAYLSLFTGAVGYLYHILARHQSKFVLCLLFSALWCLAEYARATLLTGFPWMLLGFGLIDTPLKYLLPVIGVYGVGFLACFAACALATLFQAPKSTQLPWLILFIGLLIAPSFLKHVDWTTQENQNPVSVSVIQANLSMRDKWDEALFWTVLTHYKTETEKLLGKTSLVVMPESAIPAPDSYVGDFLSAIHQKSQASNTAILLGIPEEPTHDTYYNSLIALGTANGSYQKKHLVPFGEFIPKPFQQIINWLSIPIANITEGRHDQPLVEVNHHPIATLICYELAYPNLLREQLPAAEWIVSISDDGWFGHSFAMYQQQQMAQALSIQTGRYQIVANNDGLSSVINSQGRIIKSLPAYKAGILKSKILPSIGITPWVAWGDQPVLFSCLLIMLSGMLQSYRMFRISRGFVQI